jgi:hypothetical protein
MNIEPTPMKTKTKARRNKWYRICDGIEIQPEQVFAVQWMTLKEVHAPNGKLLSSSMHYSQSNVQARDVEDAIQKLRKHYGAGGDGFGRLVVTSAAPMEIKIHIT